ncbi:hypothetical protein DOJK_02294 [Patescibacteria group bacterium]|nr:hypothetical protein DOJK_02294 [Patescibacteria group bacterium]
MRFQIFLFLLFSLMLCQTPSAFDLHSSHHGRNSAEIQAELDSLKTLPLKELDAYYTQEILEHPYAKESEIKDFVKKKLIADYLKLNTFQGYLRASQISQNPQYVLEHRDLAKTTEEKKSLEQTLVIYANPNEYFKSQFELKTQGEITKNHIKHLGVLADYSDEEKQDLTGILSVAPTEKAATLFFLGTYRITVNITTHLPSHYVRSSKVLGDEDKTKDYTETQTTSIDVAPPSLSSQKQLNYAVQISLAKHGSMGGMDERKATGQPSFTTSIIKVEAR